MNLNEFAQEVHALAVEKGFYNPDPTDTDLIAAIHSEISEAFEAWRNNEPNVWHECLDGGDIGTIDGNGCANCGECACKPSISSKPDEPCPMLDPEPHGIAAELIDVALRVLDFLSGHELEVVGNGVGDFVRIGRLSGIDALSLPDLVVRLHYVATLAISFVEQGADNCDDAGDCLNAILASIFSWLHVRDIDPEALILEKHRYNQTRPYKHGGKRV